MRLADIERSYGPQVDVHWRAFPLIPDERPGRLTTAETCAGRAKVGGQEPRAQFVPPRPGTPLPTSSVPALTAAKAAERQGRRAGAAFRDEVFVAYFRDNQDIGRADVLWRLAERIGLDMARFQADCTSGEPHRAVLRDYAEAVAWFGVSALPTVVFEEKVSLVGAVPVEHYALLVDWLLAGEPGGMIPLDGSTLAGLGAGQSPVDQARAR